MRSWRRCFAQRRRCRCWLDPRSVSSGRRFRDREELGVQCLCGRTAPAPSDRRREKRHHRDELPGLWSAKLPWGTEVTLVDVSKRGVLVETTSRVTLGSTLDLQFVGQDAQVSIPARILRTDVADVTGLGVRYRVAASFDTRPRDSQTAEAARTRRRSPRRWPRCWRGSWPMSRARPDGGASRTIRRGAGQAAAGPQHPDSAARR